MGISATGIISGLDTDLIVSQLMVIKQRPLVRLQMKQAVYKADISSFGSLSSALSSLKGTLADLKSSSIYSLSATSSDSSVFTASATSSAVEGKYSIIVNNLAQYHNLTHNTGVADKTASISPADGVFDYTVDGTNYSVTVTAGMTLEEFAAAINDADGGVQATIINTGSAYQLVLTSETMGLSGGISVSTDDTDLQMAVSYNELQKALDASFKVNNLDITRDTNTITGVIDGVTITLLKNSDGDTVTLDVSRDLAEITSNIKAFVSAYNKAANTARSLGRDFTAESIIRALRSINTTTYAGNIPAAFGLSHDKSGVLSLDSSMLGDAIENDLQGVVDTFDAMAEALEDTLDSYVKEVIPVREEGLESSVKYLELRIESMERWLFKVEENYIRKFTALEETLAQLQQMGDFLTRQLAGIREMSISIMKMRK